jgi:hypothetical protein
MLKSLSGKCKVILVCIGICTTAVQVHLIRGVSLYSELKNDIYQPKALGPSMDQNHSSFAQNDDEVEVESEDDDDEVGDQETSHQQHLTIHWNTTDRINKPTLYHCFAGDGNGMKEMRKIMLDVLPEYQLQDLTINSGKRNPTMPIHYQAENYSNEYDVFIGDFQSNLCQPAVERWLHLSFNGRVVLFSPESPTNDPIMGKDTHRIHAFGPLTEVRRDGDMWLFYFQLTWWFYFQDLLSPSYMISPTDDNKGNSTRSTRSDERKFMMYANSNCVAFREEAVGLLSQFGPVDCDGKCQGKTPPNGNRTNLIKTGHSIGVGNWWENVKLYSNYRFCFVMEHTGDHPGYITEKILMAFAGGCIPIYYGPETIFDIFNDQAFVFYNITNPQPALDLVASLELDEKLYDKMKKKPIVANGEKTIEEYFSYSDNVGKGVLKQRMREKLGLSNLMP